MKASDGCSEEEDEAQNDENTRHPLQARRLEVTDTQVVRPGQPVATASSSDDILFPPSEPQPDPFGEAENQQDATSKVNLPLLCMPLPSLLMCPNFLF